MKDTRKIWFERLERVVCLCGASACCSLAAMAGWRLWFFWVPFAALIPAVGWQLIQPDSWYQARIDRQREFARRHPRYMMLLIIIGVVSVLLSFLISR
jgi:hypothetical protein